MILHTEAAYTLFNPSAFALELQGHGFIFDESVDEIILSWRDEKVVEVTCAYSLVGLMDMEKFESDLGTVLHYARAERLQYLGFSQTLHFLRTLTVEDFTQCESIVLTYNPWRKNGKMYGLVIERTPYPPNPMLKKFVLSVVDLSSRIPEAKRALTRFAFLA